MTQRELDCEVARATGESVSVIADMGFVPLTPVPFEREPLAYDWDSGEPAPLSSLDAELAIA